MGKGSKKDPTVRYSLTTWWLTVNELSGISMREMYFNVVRFKCNMQMKEFNFTQGIYIFLHRDLILGPLAPWVI